MWIKIRTTDEEKRHWQDLAENKGVSLSEMVRELARIGNNLNQLAHAANRSAHERPADAD